MNKEWLIYMHTSQKTGKSYIGLTCKGIKRRWEQHTSDARNGSEFHFHRAIRLYGENNWNHTILVSSVDTLEEANALEKYYIKKHDTFENGYNLTEGGDNTHMSNGPIKYKDKVWWVHADFGLEYMTSWELGEKYSLNKSALVKLVRDDTSNKLFKGWQLYEEGKKVKESFKEHTYTFYHDKHGEFKGTIPELADRYSLSKSNLRKVQSGKRLQSQGWRATKNKPKPATNSKKVYMYTENGDNIAVFKAAKDCAAYLKVDVKTFSNWFRRNRYKKVDGYFYSYKNSFMLKGKEE
jgi:group I intron endonuclease